MTEPATTTTTASGSASDAPTHEPPFDIPVKARAWDLYCQGYHSFTIGRRLGVPDRTVRHWIAGQLAARKREHTAGRDDRLVLAITRQRTIAMAAWDGYERALAIQTEENATAALAADEREAAAPTRAARQALAAGARYLTIVASAEREIARLQNLYGGEVEPQPPMYLNIIRRPEGPDGPAYLRENGHDHLLSPEEARATLPPENRAPLPYGPQATDLDDAPMPDDDPDDDPPTQPNSKNENAAKLATPAGSLPPAGGRAGEGAAQAILGDTRFTHVNAAASATTASPLPLIGGSAGEGPSTTDGEGATPKRRQIHFPWPVTNIGCIM